MTIGLVPRRLQRVGVDGARRDERRRRPRAARRRRPRRPRRAPSSSSELQPALDRRAPACRRATLRARRARAPPSPRRRAGAGAARRDADVGTRRRVEQAGAEDLRPPRASDASSAGRLSVGSAIRFQSAVDRAPDWPCARSQSPKVCSSSAGSSGSSLPQRERGADRRQRARARLSGAIAEQRRRRGGAARAAPLREMNAGGLPSRSTGTRSRGWTGRGRSTPSRSRKPRYAVQQRSATCWPLSSQRPLRSTENVAPPSRVRAS